MDHVYINNKWILISPWEINARTDYILQEGVSFKGTFSFSGGLPVDGTILTIANSLNSQVFTFRTNPEPNGTDIQLPNPISSPILQSNIIEALRSNYYFSNHYDITDEFVVTSRFVGEDYNIILQPSQLLELDLDEDIMIGANAINKNHLKMWVRIRFGNDNTFEFLSTFKKIIGNRAFFSVDIRNVLVLNEILDDFDELDYFDFNFSEVDLIKNVEISVAEAIAIPPEIQAIDNLGNHTYMDIKMSENKKHLYSWFRYNDLIYELGYKLSMCNSLKQVYLNNIETVNFRMSYTETQQFKVVIVLINNLGDREVITNDWQLYNPGFISLSFHWGFVIDKFSIDKTSFMDCEIYTTKFNGDRWSQSYHFRINNIIREDIETLMIRNEFKLWETVPLVKVNKNIRIKHNNSGLKPKNHRSDISNLEYKNTSHILYQEEATMQWIMDLLSIGEGFTLNNENIYFQKIKFTNINLKKNEAKMDDIPLTYEFVNYE